MRITGLPRSPGVYRIVNTVNGKCYVGSAFSSLYRRLNEHLTGLRGNKHNSIHLQRAYNKYGEAAFKIEILYLCKKRDDVQAVCLAQEQKYINLYDAANKASGYNVLKIVGIPPMSGRNHTSATRAKMSAAKKGKPSNRTGKKHTAETKAKIAATKIGLKASAETRAKMSATRTGKKMTELHRLASKAAHWSKGPRAAEIAAKIARGNTGLVKSQEVRDKIRATKLRQARK